MVSINIIIFSEKKEPLLSSEEQKVDTVDET